MLPKKLVENLIFSGFDFFVFISLFYWVECINEHLMLRFLIHLKL